MFWVHASNAARYEQGFRGIADHLKLAGREDPKTDVTRLVYDWMCSVEHQWLLVLDNLNDTSFLLSRADKKSEGLSIENLPRNERSSVLITTKNRSLAMQLMNPQNVIPVSPMTPAEAVTLFMTKLDTSDGGDDIPQLVAELEYIPLVIVQVASYISARAPRCTVAKYLFDYRESEKKRVSLLDYEARSLRHDGNKNSVIATWLMSFEHIRETNRSAAELLCLMSFFHHQGIPQDLLFGMTKHKAKLSLGEQESREFASNLEPILPGKEAEKHKRRTRSMRRKAYYFRTLMERGSLKRVEHLERGLPMDLSPEQHKIWDRAEADSKQLRGKEEREKTAEADRNYQEGKAERNRGAQSSQTDVSSDDSDTGPFEDDIVVLHDFSFISTETEGKTFNTHVLVQLATRSWLKSNGEFDRYHSQFVSGLCTAFKARMHHDWTDCQALYVHAKQSAELKPDTAASLLEWALLLYNAALYALEIPEAVEAKDLALKSLNVQLELLGEDDRATVCSMSVVASAYALDKQWDEAEKLQVHVLEVRRKILGKEHPETLVSMFDLASTYRNQGRLEEAAVLQERVLDVRKKVLGEEHPDTLVSMLILASTYHHQQRLEEGAGLYEDSLEKCRRILGEAHPHTLSSMRGLAVVWKSQRQHENAMHLLQQCVEIALQMYGADSPEAASNSALLEEWKVAGVDLTTEKRRKRDVQVASYLIPNSKLANGYRYNVTSSTLR